MSPRIHRKPNLKDLTKNIDKRKYVWLLGMIALLMIDEYVKEGYFFDPADLSIYGTHEFLIGIILSLIITLGLYDLTKNIRP